MTAATAVIGGVFESSPEEERRVFPKDAEIDVHGPVPAPRAAGVSCWRGPR